MKLSENYFYTLREDAKDEESVSGNLLVKSGELSEEDAKNHPKKNVLMKALGSSTNVDMDIFDVELSRIL